jgi:cytochrome P450
LISSGLLALLQHPEQLAKLRENPARIDGAIEEILRWHHPDQSTSTPRWTTEDVRIGGTTIPRHATVRLSLGAANRDPAQFPAPDTFDIARAPNRHLSFGRGNHFCLGASLARLEAKIAIQTVACADGRLELLTENPHRDPRRPDRYAKILVRVRTGDNPLP